MADNDLRADSTENPEATPEKPLPQPGKPSQRWFWSAVAATVVGTLVLVALFAGLRPPALEADSESPSVSPGESSEPLVIAVARTPGGPTEWSNYARIIKALSEDLGIPVDVRYLSKEDEAAAVIAGEGVDVAFVCANQYLKLRDDGAVVGLASPTIDGEHLTVSRLVVRADDAADSFEDLAGSAVAASDKSSLGGYAYLNALCAEHGTTPEEHFSEVRLGETQEDNMRAVLDGDVRATVVNSVQVAAWDMSGFKVAEESEPFGTPPVVVSADMDPELVRRIEAFLVGFDSTILPPESHVTGFVKLDDADYEYAETLRDACGHHPHP